MSYRVEPCKNAPGATSRCGLEKVAEQGISDFEKGREANDFRRTDLVLLDLVHGPVLLVLCVEEDGLKATGNELCGREDGEGDQTNLEDVVLERLALVELELERAAVEAPTGGRVGQ